MNSTFMLTIKESDEYLLLTTIILNKTGVFHLIKVGGGHTLSGGNTSSSCHLLLFDYGNKVKGCYGLVVK